MKKVIVDKSLCIGCGACAQIDSEDFKIGNDGLSELKNENAQAENPNVVNAMESCPTGAIQEKEEENASN